MTPLALVLVTISTFSHALWNFLGKRQNPETSFFTIAAMAGGIFLLPVLFVFRQIIPLIPAGIWGLILLTGACQSVYYAGLAGAYRHGQLSVAYPLVRATPAVLTPLVCLALNLGAPVSFWGYAGMLMVVLGCFCIPLDSFRQFRPANYFNMCCAMALLAACGTTGYSIIDSEILRFLRSLPSGMHPVEIAYVFLAFETMATFIILAIFTLVLPGKRNLRLLDRKNFWKPAVLTGLMICLTYGLVLAAMAYVSNVSYLVAFRELSIPLGALLGIFVQKEPAPAPKMIGMAAVMAGLVVVSLV